MKQVNLGSQGLVRLQSVWAAWECRNLRLRLQKLKIFAFDRAADIGCTFWGYVRQYVWPVYE